MGKYISNLARHFIGQLRVRAEDFGKFPAQELYAHHNKAIKAQLHRMRPETLGRIAACGKGCSDENREESPQTGTLYLVHCSTYLDKYADGVTLLREIACTAIVAEMANILERR